jgi:hypothetical protein
MHRLLCLGSSWRWCFLAAWLVLLSCCATGTFASSSRVRAYAVVFEPHLSRGGGGHSIALDDVALDGSARVFIPGRLSLRDSPIGVSAMASGHSIAAHEAVSLCGVLSGRRPSGDDVDLVASITRHLRATVYSARHSDCRARCKGKRPWLLCCIGLRVGRKLRADLCHNSAPWCVSLSRA